MFLLTPKHLQEIKLVMTSKAKAINMTWIQPKISCKLVKTIDNDYITFLYSKLVDLDDYYYYKHVILTINLYIKILIIKMASITNSQIDGKDHDYMFKLVLLGSSGVGKSNILLRLTRN